MNIELSVGNTLTHEARSSISRVQNRLVPSLLRDCSLLLRVAVHAGAIDTKLVLPIPEAFRKSRN